MRRTALILTFVIFVLAFIVAAHVYLARRLVLDPGLAEPLRGAALAGIAVLGASLVLQPVGERLLRPRFARWIAWPASLWMGFAFLMLVGFAATDALLWLAGSVARADAGAFSGGAAPGARAALISAGAVLVGLASTRRALRAPHVRRVAIRLPRWPRALDGFRIVQISDVHIGPILGRRFAEDVTARANALEPDLVAVTGDLVDGRVSLLADEVAPFGGLRARHGVFFVTGNHDHYSGANAWAREVERLSMRVLRNERVEIGSGDAVFDLAGVDDHRSSGLLGGGEDLTAALAGRDPGRPLVLLAHDPTTFAAARRLGVDLQLSGHTHGGQIWPFRYLVRLAVPWVAGLHRDGDAQLYVSCGTGFWGPPMRLGAPAEITEIELRADAREETDR